MKITTPTTPSARKRIRRLLLGRGVSRGFSDFTAPPGRGTADAFRLTTRMGWEADSDEGMVRRFGASKDVCEISRNMLSARTLRELGSASLSLREGRMAPSVRSSSVSWESYIEMGDKVGKDVRRMPWRCVQRRKRRRRRSTGIEAKGQHRLCSACMRRGQRYVILL